MKYTYSAIVGDPDHTGSFKRFEVDAEDEDHALTLGRQKLGLTPEDEFEDQAELRN